MLNSSKVEHQNYWLIRKQNRNCIAPSPQEDLGKVLDNNLCTGANRVHPSWISPTMMGLTSGFKCLRPTIYHTHQSFCTTPTTSRHTRIKFCSQRKPARLCFSSITYKTAFRTNPVSLKDMTKFNKTLNK